MHTLPGRVLQKFMEDQAPNWAVLIAWNALFALFPIVVFMAAVLGIVAGIIGESRTIYCHAAQSQTTPLDCTLLSLLPSQTVPGAFEAIMAAHRINQDVIAMQHELVEALGLPRFEPPSVTPDPLRQTLYDRFGDYTVAFHSAAVVAFAATVMVLAIRERSVLTRPPAPLTVAPAGGA